MPGIQEKLEEQKECSGSEESIEDQDMMQNDGVVAIDDIILSEDTMQDNKQQSTQGEDMKDEHTLETMERTEGHAEDYSEPQKQMEKAEIDCTETEVDDEDEGIGVDEGEVDITDNTEAVDDSMAVTEEGNLNYYFSQFLMFSFVQEN